MQLGDNNPLFRVSVCVQKFLWSFRDFFGFLGGMAWLAGITADIPDDFPIRVLLHYRSLVAYQAKKKILSEWYAGNACTQMYVDGVHWPHWGTGMASDIEDDIQQPR